ncbi:hypothetical protein [Polycladidibacter stylochi]|uniref:hypothetical protein n=1 Tax=Polycladidibacter stylochi TaxID=1807766 RepID=UPI0008374639|nr:hypothetical protein [Pseudovibrio stylochi]
MLKVLLASLALFVANMSVNAAPIELESFEESVAPKNTPVELPQNSPITDGNYIASKPILAQYWAAPLQPNQEMQQIVIPEGASLTVLNWVEDDEKGSLVRIGIEAVEGSDLPTDIYISADAFAKFSLKAAPKLSLMDEDLLNLDEDSIYDEAISDKYASRRSSARSRKRRRGMTYCYRYVKKHLLKNGLVNTYLPGGSAYMAKNTLPKHGFKRLHVSNPTKAPNGAICVYDRDGRHRHGHIEVKKSDSCYWYGYGCKANSMYGKRKFVDCYVKGGKSYRTAKK